MRSAVMSAHSCVVSMRIARRERMVSVLRWTAFMLLAGAGCSKNASSFDGQPVGGESAVYTTCGNGVIDATEECDEMNLHEESCKSLGMGSGMLACDPITCSYDTSMCTGHPVSGGGTGGG